MNPRWYMFLAAPLTLFLRPDLVYVAAAFRSASSAESHRSNTGPGVAARSALAQHQVCHQGKMVGLPDTNHRDANSAELRRPLPLHFVS